MFTASKYDHRNLPLQVWDRSSGTTYYSYDDGGNRIHKKVGTGSVTNEYYLRDHTGKEVALYNVNNNKLNQVKLFGNGMIGYVKKENTTDERFYFVKDHLGSVRLTLNGNGIESGKDYFAYGNIMPTRSINYGEADRYDYTEKERDAETGLHYFGARYYDSDISNRWLSVDPLADLYPGVSPYNYVNNNPLRFIDLYGMTPSDSTYLDNGYELDQVTVTALRSNNATLPIWISTGWGIALGEPTPVGEIIMGVGTGAYLTYSLYNTFNNEEAEAEENETVDDKPKGKIWDKLKPFRGKTKTNGLQGSKRRFFEWDHTHKDLEVYDKNGNHLGSQDPNSGKFIKRPVPGRRINIR